MAVDWGEVAGTVIGGILDDWGVTTPAPYGGPMGPVGTPLPTEVTVNTKTGQVKPCRRRRRRRLLTPTDISDLAALVAIAGKGAGMNLAIAKAVRR